MPSEVSSPSTTGAMPLEAALQALHNVRTDEIVVTAMGAARVWMTLGEHPQDFILVPSSMGQAPALGLGMALARPDRKVIVCNGDGSMLMNLGALVTITAAAPKNLIVLLFDNGVYEVTGQQATPGAPAGRAGGTSVDYAAMARASGFDEVHTFDSLSAWDEALPALLQTAGPVFAQLKVAPNAGAVGPKSPGPGRERARRFAEALASTNQ